MSVHRVSSGGRYESFGREVGVVPVLAGDGIGPAVIDEAVDTLIAAGFDEPLVPFAFGDHAWRREGTSLPPRTLDAVRARGVALVGAATTSVDGPGSPTLALRRALGLDLLVRPAKGADVDVVVVGHAFEGLFGSEEEAGPDGVRLARVVTRAGVTRLLTEARRHVRRRLTVVDKPTVFRQTAALFRSCGAEEIDNLDAVVARLVARPGHDDVLVGLSFVSDVLSDLTAALAGGVGAVASCSLGPDVAVFEPVHGSAPRRTERPLAVDPSGAILAGAMLARHLGHDDIADGIEAAVRVVAPQRGQLSTRGFGEAVRRAL